MFRKLRITGKLKRALVLFITLALLISSIAFEAEAAAADRFDDVDPSDWYYEYVATAVDAGLFKGTSTFHFQPKKAITRAEFVTALAKLCKADVASYSSEPFTDITPDHWGYHFIAWGYAKGIVRGVGGNLFAPSREITRQEMCVMLVQAVENVLGARLPTTGNVVFTDYWDSATWARMAIKKCAYGGLVTGYNDEFRPLGIANRAEAATILCSYYRKNRATPLLEVSGFYINFFAGQTFYYCTDADFDECRILRYNGSGAISNVQVEHYQTGIKPYSATAYKLGDRLNLGYERAKLTFKIGTKNYTIMLTDAKDANWTKSLARITGAAVNLRSGASTDHSVIKVLSKNTWVYPYEKTGNWWRVKVAATGQIGYVSASYLRLSEYGEVAMPARYKAKIDALKRAHPNWTFSFVNVGVNYNEAPLKYAADISYIDPLNYLNEENIYAFMDVRTYEFGNWTAEQVGAIWDHQPANSSITRSQAIEWCLKTSKSALMNPLYIACRAVLESGYAASTYARGASKVTNVTVDNVYYDPALNQYYNLGGMYYNFYGIGAKDSMPNYAFVKAKELGWNTKDRAFGEGAAWIKEEYLDWGDATPYFFRYAYKTNYSYMSDPAAPQKEAKILKKACSGKYSKVHFIIPVYNNMPS